MRKMVDSPKKRTALGQGLNALIPMDEPAGATTADGAIRYVPIESLEPNPQQPRRVFSEAALAELADSIREIGVIQPLIVRSRDADRYEIVAGERRWRASGMAGYRTIPVIVRDVSDGEALEIALIENVQREDLNPLDTAEAYDLLIKKFSYTHEALAKRVGTDRSNITNYLRLLNLPDPIKEEVRQERLSMGHARTLLAVDHLPSQLKLSHQAVKRHLSVRELERIVQNYKKKQDPPPPRPAVKDDGIATLEKELSRKLAAKVTIRKNANNSGRLEIHFHSTEEFTRILADLGYSEDFA